MIGLKATSAVGFYTLFVYMTVYFTHIVQIPKSDALAINTLALAAMLVMIPGAGALSDWLGRKPLLIAGAVGMLLFSLPLFHLLRSPKFGVILTGQLCFTVILCLFFGQGLPLPRPFPHECAAAAQRSPNVCFAVLGGTAPMVATYLIARTQNDMAPSIYLMAAALVSIVAILSLSDHQRAVGIVELLSAWARCVTATASVAMLCADCL